MQDRIGVRVQMARKLVDDLSARELDRLAGLKAEGHTSLIESGVTNNVKVETARGIARVLGVSLDWLIDGAGDAPTIESVQAAVDVARAARADESDSHHNSTAADIARIASG